MTPDDIRRVVEQWQSAITRHDTDACLTTYADDVRVESPLGGTVTGHDGVRRVFSAFFKAFPDAVIAGDPPIVDGQRVVVVASVSGTHMGDFMGLAGGGHTFRVPMVFLLEFRDGLIARERRIYDFTGLLVQVGVLKAKPA